MAHFDLTKPNRIRRDEEETQTRVRDIYPGILRRGSCNIEESSPDGFSKIVRIDGHLNGASARRKSVPLGEIRNEK
jgi:hypothetical protein